MKQVLLAAVAVMALAGGAVRANPLDDAKSALAALDKGDNPTAIRLFTSALDSGRLTRTDQELAYAKRAEAYLAASDDRAALSDANHALNIDPRDSEAVATRDRAQTLLNPPVAPAARVAPDAGGMAKADYEAAQAKYEAQKRADADSYAQQVASYDAQVKAQDAKRQADLDAWHADVEACKAGELSKCAGAKPAPPAQVGPQSPAALVAAGRPARQATAVAGQTAAKAPPRPVKKPSTPPSSERPIIY